MVLDNPVNARVRQSERVAAANLFGIPAEAAGGRYLQLRRYLFVAPERFFARDVQRTYLTWLDGRHACDQDGLRDYMADNIAEIEQALLFLREINVEDWHDTLADYGNEWELLRFVDTRVHRAYLRLVEGVLTPLARMAAHFSRRDRNAGTDGLDIYAIAQELAKSQLAVITRSYHHTVRNGIGHGGLTYRTNDISYRDKKGNEAILETREVVRLCDDLLDDCNGLAAALAVFLIQHRANDYPMPEELLVQELAEETDAPWWSIEGAVRSEVPTGSQLLVFARTSTQSFQKIQFSAVQSGILAEAFVPGYDRYLLSLRGREGLGMVVLSGDRLRAHRTAGDDLSAYSDVLESILFYPVRQRPRWISRIETMIESFRLNWPALRREWYAARGIPHIVPRHATLHPNGLRSVLNGAVVMEEPDPANIRRHRWRIIRSALGIAIANPQSARYYPLGCAQISVFCHDYRKRRLKDFELGDDLVCTVRYQTIKRIRSPDIIGSTVEVTGSWRIAWNRAWLDREQISLNTPSPWHTRNKFRKSI